MAKKIKIKTAEELKMFRIRKNLNQYEFAELTGISRSAIAKKEIGLRPLTFRDEVLINSVNWANLIN